MELYGLALNAGYTGFNFGSRGGGDTPFVETQFVVEVTVRELPGDYNLDGTVDGADYSVWRAA